MNSNRVNIWIHDPVMRLGYSIYIKHTKKKIHKAKTQSFKLKKTKLHIEIKRMKLKFDIKNKWNKTIRDEIEK